MMALSSSTGYDVFVSFRGEDIRRTFVSHLYRSLERKGIRTFKDETELNLEPSEIHLAAIRASKIAIVVVSKNYVSSPWILRELDEILNCHRRRYLTVFPVYYGVDSCDVEGLAEEFSTDQKQNPEKVGISAWRNALTELVCISGEHSNKWEDDAELILRITNAIWNTLSSLYKRPSDEDILGTEKSSFCVSNSLTGNTAFKCVGMDSRIKAVSGLMEVESENEIRIVGIWGVEGVGKMTLARCVYEETMQYFHIHVFLENVGKIYQDHGASGLNEELLWDNIIREAFTVRSSKNSFDVTKARLQNRKVLLVVDGVNNKEQIEDVQNVATWFGAGSRVLVTTRDENLLVVNGLTHVYEVKCLRVHEALQLFYHFAFTEQAPSTRFKQLSVRAVQLAGRIPLSLKVLGSFLCGKSALQWESELQTLSKQRANEKAKVGVSSDKKPDDYRNVNMAIGSDMTASKVITYPKEKTHVTSDKKPDDYRNVKMGIGSDVTASKVITYRKEKTDAYGLLFAPFWGTFSNFRNTSETQSVVVASPNSLTIPIEMLGYCEGRILNFTHILGHFFGVYDGYCGSQVAGFYVYILNSAFAEEIELKKDSICNTSPMENRQVQWKKVFTNFFQKIDEKAAARISFATTGSSDRVLEAVALEFIGSTAVVALICSSHIIVSNRGNSRAVLLRGKESMPLTVDHKPDREEEDAGKEKAGGEVIQSQGIITNSGDLKTSRSTGDRNLKPYIIPDPEVTFLPRTREDVCLILASDGLWDVMSNQEACDFVRKRIMETKEPSSTGVWEDHACKEAAENLFRLALQKGSKDDISIIVFNLRR